MKIDIVSTDDWCTLYIKEKLVLEGHNLDMENLIICVAKACLVQKSNEELDFNQNYVNEATLEEHFASTFPTNLKSIKPYFE